MLAFLLVVQLRQALDVPLNLGVSVAEDVHHHVDWGLGARTITIFRNNLHVCPRVESVLVSILDSNHILAVFAGLGQALQLLSKFFVPPDRKLQILFVRRSIEAVALGERRENFLVLNYLKRWLHVLELSLGPLLVATAINALRIGPGFDTVGT